MKHLPFHFYAIFSCIIDKSLVMMKQLLWV